MTQTRRSFFGTLLGVLAAVYVPSVVVADEPTVWREYSLIFDRDGRTSVYIDGNLIADNAFVSLAAEAPGGLLKPFEMRKGPGVTYVGTAQGVQRVSELPEGTPPPKREPVVHAIQGVDPDRSLGIAWGFVGD